eukprot:6545390-Prymnesium_polylepis.1
MACTIGQRTARFGPHSGDGHDAQDLERAAVLGRDHDLHTSARVGGSAANARARGRCHGGAADARPARPARRVRAPSPWYARVPRAARAPPSSFRCGARPRTGFAGRSLQGTAPGRMDTGHGLGAHSPTCPTAQPPSKPPCAWRCGRWRRAHRGREVERVRGLLGKVEQ